MSSHREAPSISQDPVADNADTYAFVSPDDPTTVTIITNYVPLQGPPGGPNFFEFGDDVLYSIYIDNDAWALGDSVTIGGLRAAGAPAAELYFVASGTNGGGHIELHVSGSSIISLGAIAANQFRCFEVGWDGAVVTAYAGAMNKGSAPLTLPVDSAEVGMEYALGANPNAGKIMEYDDVVIARAPIGCLH